MTYLLSEGKRGAAPDYAALLLAARDLHCPPWELAERPLFWQQWNATVNRAINRADERRAQLRQAHAANRRALGV